MKTLRKEAIELVDTVLSKYHLIYEAEEAAEIVDALLVLRGFSFLQTDKDSPEYIVRGSQEWKDKLGEELAENNIEAAIYAGKPLGKAASKQTEVYKLEEMICKELARLPYNFEGDRTQEQESFRKFLKEKRKLGQELEIWVNWWMSDEWRVANPPWNLVTIKKKWFDAFPKKAEAKNVETDEHGSPVSY